MQREIILIAHNIRSCHNVGSLLRTAEGLGVNKVYLTGYTPYPNEKNDKRLPHISSKVNRQIHKTSLGAENMITWQHEKDIKKVIKSLQNNAYTVYALEQSSNSIKLPNLKAPDKVAVIVGREVEGIEPEVLNLTDKAVEIPMFGQKESFNVVQAAAMALHKLTFD